LLFHCPFDQASLIAETVRAQIESLTCRWLDDEISIRASVGVVEITHQHCALADLLSAVDFACHSAKREGGNRIQALRHTDDHFRRRDNYFSRTFQLLKKLHVDHLKIHEDFVRNITNNSVDYEVVLGISRVAKTLRINTIASGVSNLATREVLRGMGVDYAQGFLVEAPRPISVSHAVH
jgi:predicted signal transduction protein with EAL and GGDEF domain